VIAKVPTHLTHYCRYGEIQEFRTGFDVVAVHGIDQTETRDLYKIFEWLSAVLESSRDVIGKGQTAADDRVALAPEV
jgi:hypothetical protein